MTDHQIRELLREMRDEAVPADSLARVRMGVEERTAGRRRRWWIPVIALAAVAVLALALFLRHPARPISSPVPVVAKVTRPEPKPVAAVTRPPVLRPRAKPVRKVEAVSTAIRIETADPDVVLIMVTGGAED
jgi:anti-sigma-K factor RskA